MRTIPPDDVGLVNCASCDCELIGEKTIALLLDGWSLGEVNHPKIGGRREDRPYCVTCFSQEKETVE